LWACPTSLDTPATGVAGHVYRPFYSVPRLRTTDRASGLSEQASQVLQLGVCALWEACRLLGGYESTDSCPTAQGSGPGQGAAGSVVRPIVLRGVDARIGLGARPDLVGWLHPSSNRS